jgi:inosine-uridine nucleoside N-ribohydrolase
MSVFIYAVIGYVALCQATTPVPIILDTDLGDDIDDTWALAFLLGREEISIQLVVTAADDTPTKTRLLAKMLSYIGRTDIPIGIGVKTSDRPINQAQWLGDFSLKDYRGKVYEDGVQAMIDHIRAAEHRITLCVIGPETNVAEALRRAPEIAEKARVVAMAGSVYVGYNGARERAAEWNIIKDVAAAKAVFKAPWEITLAPLDLCGTLRLQGPLYQRVADAATPLARVVRENYDAWTHRKEYPKDASSVLFDTAAAYLCFDEANVDTETIPLIITENGMTEPNPAGRPVRCALRWKDVSQFQTLLVETLTRTPSQKQARTIKHSDAH